MPHSIIHYIQVALPVPLYQVFDYALPADMPTPPIGGRVRVPFGRGKRKLLGVVVTHLTQSNLPQAQIKSVIDIIDETPLLDAPMLTLASWLATYYHYPLGDTLSVMLPKRLREGDSLDILVTYWRLTRYADIDKISPAAPKQRQQFEIISLHGQQGVAESVLRLEGIETTYLKKFADMGLVESYVEPQCPPPPVEIVELPHTLNTQQTQAVNTIKAASGYSAFLLDGITGSGKTEVYLQAMQPVLATGKQVLILVPEIGLTPQAQQRYASRFQAKILMLHSNLNSSLRLRGWHDTHLGHAQIIIGTRSAILYPYANLGLIIVDEEHDSSYKQFDTLRYHARDVALYRGQQLDCPVVLGSATPSLESLHRVQHKKLTLLRLTQRAGDATPPTMQLLDRRGKKLHDGLTEPLLNAIEHTLAKQEQVLVFLNRRGFAPMLLCDYCGWQALCPRCDIPLTLHQQPVQQLRCHHCDWQASVPTHCDACHSDNLNPVGVGTSRITQSLQQYFPNHAVIQVDRDTTRRKDSWQEIYNQVAATPAAILVGTQILAKGHHFPNVTLVALPNIDYAFLSADFRAPEKTAQLIMQVAGRAGRAGKSGQVLIQTLQPDNPLLLTLIRSGYAALAQTALADRRSFGLPPATHAALVRAESSHAKRNHTFLTKALLRIPSADVQRFGLRILGPIEAPMAKRASRHHTHLLFMCDNRRGLHQILSDWWQPTHQAAGKAYIRISLDIDPVSWS